MKIRITSCGEANQWYKNMIGEVMVAKESGAHSYWADAFPVEVEFGGAWFGVLKGDYEVVNEAPIQSSIDKHYSFNYTLSEEEKEVGVVKIDPYFVAKQWELGKKDNTGVLFHCLKTLARFGDKNPVEREIVALYKQIVRLAELEKISLS